jgi:hypothetical protein
LGYWDTWDTRDTGIPHTVIPHPFNTFIST